MDAIAFITSSIHSMAGAKHGQAFIASRRSHEEAMGEQLLSRFLSSLNLVSFSTSSSQPVSFSTYQHPPQPRAYRQR